MSVHRILATIGVIVAATVLMVVLVPATQAQTSGEKIAYAALPGQVLPLQFAQVGQTVKQGDILLFVRMSIGGAVPAARAPVDGRVTRMLVNVGDTVNIGDPVAVIETSP